MMLSVLWDSTTKRSLRVMRRFIKRKREVARWHAQEAEDEARASRSSNMPELRSMPIFDSISNGAETLRQVAADENLDTMELRRKQLLPDWSIKIFLIYQRGDQALPDLAAWRSGLPSHRGSSGH